MTPVEYLIYCYFGNVEDPILAAIDRAYVDMAAHTVSTPKKKKEEDIIFQARKKGTEVIHNKIVILDKETDYDEWHRNVVEQVKEECHIYSYGQIQKWLNMTVKYLYTLKALGVEKINDIFVTQNAKMFHAPIDSYVLNEIGRRRGEKPDLVWSKDIGTYEQYLNIEEEISFGDEYDNWSSYIERSKYKKSGEPRKADKHTYRRYLQDTDGYKFNRDRE